MLSQKSRLVFQGKKGHVIFRDFVQVSRTLSHDLFHVDNVVTSTGPGVPDRTVVVQGLYISQNLALNGIAKQCIIHSLSLFQFIVESWKRITVLDCRRQIRRYCCSVYSSQIRCKLSWVWANRTSERSLETQPVVHERHRLSKPPCSKNMKKPDRDHSLDRMF